MKGAADAVLHDPLVRNAEDEGLFAAVGLGLEEEGRGGRRHRK